MSQTPEETPRVGSSLSLKDGLELALLAGHNVDAHWAQFYVSLFGLLAWLSSNISKIGYSEAFIVTIATLAFFTLNAIATIRAYVLLSLIIDETNHVAQHSVILSKAVQKFVATKRNRMVLPMRIPIAATAHAAGAAAVIYVAWKGISA